LLLERHFHQLIGLSKNYGLSVYYPTDLKKLATAYFERDKSGAPFHPTPKGQEVIAGMVAPEVSRLLSHAPAATSVHGSLGTASGAERLQVSAGISASNTS
jgi:hypothetical protein